MMKYKYHFLAFVLGFLACFGLYQLKAAQAEKKALDEAHPWVDIPLKVI